MFDIFTRGPQKVNELIPLNRITRVHFVEGIAERPFCDGYSRDGGFPWREVGLLGAPACGPYLYPGGPGAGLAWDQVPQGRDDPIRKDTGTKLFTNTKPRRPHPELGYGLVGDETPVSSECNLGAHKRHSRSIAKKGFADDGMEYVNGLI